MAVTIGNLSLKDITLKTLPRLKLLRELHFNTRPEICLELPRLMKYYMKYLDNDLSSQMQDEIIIRAEYNLNTGEEVLYGR